MRINACLITLLVLAASCAEASVKTRIAVITPEPSAFTDRYAGRLEESLEPYFRVLDRGLAASAFASLKVEAPFNQTRDSAKRIGAVVGCEHFVLVNAETSRRSSSARPSYFEASAFIFMIDARSGELRKFLIATKQADAASDAENALVAGVGFAAASIDEVLRTKPAVSEGAFEMFDPGYATMRPAMPYRRIKPQYTATAFLYDVKATVDAEVSIDETGVVRNVDIVRWAGFGLEESVIDAVNKMNWRAGERNGKPLPMRVLLRYNFTKIEKEPQ
jgi:hypothetical protein